jgi:flavorubredoxin
MQELFKPIKVTDRVYWVGAIDWTLRDFHGYSTNQGTTYNAFLVLGEKIALIDTVKSPFREEMMRRISGVVDPKKIDIIVSNHAEMDHSGCLNAVVRDVEPEKIVASPAGVKALEEHFLVEGNTVAVKDGESLSLGNMELTFVETPMLHWPESMFTWCGEEGILFSQDGFGMHVGSVERFDDELADSLLEYEAAKYYGNILLPYSNQVGKQLERILSLGWDIRMLAPDHGPIWREDPQRVLDWYIRWSKQEPTNKAVVIYATMWESTAMMARAVTDGLAAGGANVRLMPLKVSHRSDVATELLEAGAVLIGSPNLNNEIYPAMADVLTYLRGLKKKNLVGAAFASYGWSPLILKKLNEELDKLKVEKVSDGVSCKYVPDGKVFDECFQLGKSVAERLPKAAPRGRKEAAGAKT